MHSTELYSKNELNSHCACASACAQLMRWDRAFYSQQPICPGYLLGIAGALRHASEAWPRRGSPSGWWTGAIIISTIRKKPQQDGWGKGVSTLSYTTLSSLKDIAYCRVDDIFFQCNCNILRNILDFFNTLWILTNNFLACMAPNEIIQLIEIRDSAWPGDLSLVRNNVSPKFTAEKCVACFVWQVVPSWDHWKSRCPTISWIAGQMVFLSIARQYSPFTT